MSYPASRRATPIRPSAAALLLVAQAACGVPTGTPGPSDAAAATDSAARVDAGARDATAPDAQQPDVAVALDASEHDAITAHDASLADATDAAHATDAAPRVDAITAHDGALGDGGSSARPGPTNTGVPAGTVLTPSGNLRLTTPGQVIDGLDVAGCVEVHAANVTIRRTRIRCTDYYPVRIFDGASLLIEDSEVAASGGIATSCIAFNNYVARRVNLHGSADGLKADSNVTVEDSWIHDLWLGPGDHADGIQGTGGANVVVHHNFIDVVDHGLGHGGSPNSGMIVGTESGVVNSHWTIDSNWFYGGGWVIYYNSRLNDTAITHNRFGRGPAEVVGQPNYPEYGPFDITGPVTPTGNVWDATGLPVPM